MRFIAFEVLLPLALIVASELCLSSSDFGRRCRPHEFRCKQTKKCIDRQMVQNEFLSCGRSDNSDEDGPPFKRCHPPTEFRCRKSGQCISRRFVNVAVSGCHDYSDADGIASFSCGTKTEFKCSAGNCIPRSAVNNKNGECHDARFSDEGIPGGLQCHPATEFKCADGGRCIRRDQVLDKRRDCPDGEDENVTSRIEPCAPSTGEFLCPDGRCVERWRVGDGTPDCDTGVDSADEISGAISQCNRSTEFRCGGETPAGKSHCIPRSWVNDGLSHCADGSDEQVKSFPCTENEWPCDDGTKCLSRNQLCDGILNCDDCSDETDPAICSKNQTSRFFVCAKPKGLGETFNQSGIQSSHCIYRSYFCDGVADCADGSDEQKTGEGFKCRITNDNTGQPSVCILPPHLINDDVSDCDDGSDEARHFPVSVSGHYCLSNSLNSGSLTVIRKSQVCDGIFDCSDLSDECLCHVMQSKSTRDVCDRVCRYGDHDPSGLCDGCGLGFVGCETGNNVTCIQIEMICDGKSDCADGSDEASCRTTVGVSPTDRSREIPYPCPMNETLKYLSHRYTEVASVANRCDGLPECVGLHDECDNVTDDVMCAHVKARPMYCEHLSGVWACDNGRKPLIPAFVCDGVNDCTDGIDEKFCENIRFKCEVIKSSTDTRRKVSIKQSQVCDGDVDCLDRSDELSCSNHFYCRDNSTPLFVDLKMVLDGKRDCSDGSDECPDDQVFADDPLSSRDQMIKNSGLKIWLWIMAVVAIVGNTSVIVSSVRKVSRTEYGKDKQKCCPRNKGALTGAKVGRPTSSLAKCIDILVLNLAVADLLTGIYLIIIAIKSLEFAGSYCVHQVTWRSSSQCQSLGVLVLTSCQASVGIMVTLTTYRLYAVVKPWNMSRARVKVVIGWICVTWVFAIGFSLLPTLRALEDAFVTSSIISNTGRHQGAQFFPGLAVTKKKLGEFVEMACLLLNNGNAGVPKICYEASMNVSSWYTLRKTTEHLVPGLLTDRNIGYYGTHGVCLPTLYHINSTVGAHFTLFIMVFNFVSFAYIASAYAVILYRSAASQKPSQSTADVPNPQSGRRKPANRVKEMHSRITRLIVTDFVCWMPVCILSFCGISGVNLPPIVYTLTAVVLLPINSALNPLLYSDVIQSLSCAVLRKVRYILTGSMGRRKDSFPFTSDRSNSISNQRRLSVKPEVVNCDVPDIDPRAQSSGTVRDRFISLMLLRDKKENHALSRIRTQLTEIDTSHAQLRHNQSSDALGSNAEALIPKTTTL